MKSRRCKTKISQLGHRDRVRPIALHHPARRFSRRFPRVHVLRTISFPSRETEVIWRSAQHGHMLCPESLRIDLLAAG